MPKPVSMFRTEDGQLFEKLSDAVLHEQATFVRSGLGPLFKQLLSKVNHRVIGEDLDEMAASLVDAAAGDKELLANFQKLFAKLQLAPSAPVTRRRKPQKKTPDTTAPQPTAPEVSPDHLAGLEGLAAGGPINLPEFEGNEDPPFVADPSSTDEEAPPPPPAH